MDGMEHTLPGIEYELKSIPHFDQYFGIWAMPEYAFNKHVNLIRSLDIDAHITEARRRLPIQKDAAATYENVNGIAVVELIGTMTKYSSSIGLWQGTILTRQAIRTARRDPNINAILLRIDSPGGSASGTGDLADEVARAAMQKPVYAFIEDLGASAAYWVASQATKVFANPTAEVGSIGVYGVIEDYSAAYAKEGIRTIVVKAGKYKATGVQGAPVTEEQISDYQRTVNDFHKAFTTAVANGRKMSAAMMETVATGQVWMAPEAKQMRLIDGITSFESILGDMQTEFKKQKSNKEGGIKMTDSTEALNDSAAIETQPGGTGTTPEAPPEDTPKAATIQDLEAALPNAGAEFICSQLKAGSTVEQAKDAFIAQLNQEVATAKAEAEKAKAAAKRPGVDTLGGGTSDDAGGGAIEQWNSLVAECRKDCKSQRDAIRMACKKDPDLHRAYIEEYNAAHGG